MIRLRTATVFLAIAIMLLASAMTGCSQKPAPTATATVGASTASTADTATVGASTAAVATSASTADTATPTPAADLKPITITIADEFANYDPIIKQLAVQYKVNHPNVSVDIVASGTGDYGKALQAMVAANNYPEIAIIPRGAGEAQYIQNDLLLDLSDRPVIKIMTELNKQTHEYNGKVYSVSTGVGTYGLIYNKDVFKACGIANPPTTLTELKNDCATFTSKGYTPFLPQFKTDWACGQFFEFGVDPILDENAGLVDNVLAGKAKFTDSGSPALGIFPFLELLKDNAGKNPFNYETFGNSLALFASGKVAMAIHGDWLIPPILQIDKTYVDKVGMVPIPWSDDPSKNKLVIFYNDGYGIFKNSKYVDEGIKFFDYFYTLDGQNYLAKTGGGTPSCMIGADTSFADPYARDLIVTEQNPDNVYGDLEFSKLPGAATAEINSDMQAYLAGTITKEQVLQKIQTSVEIATQNK